MRIASGLSEINFHFPDTKIRAEKYYVWPVYNAGKVESVHGITRQTDSNAVYAKPTVEDRERIMTLASKQSLDTYTQRGNRLPHQGIQPGSFFDAIV